MKVILYFSGFYWRNFMSENGVEVESWYVLTFSPKNIETDFIIFVPFITLGTNITVAVKICPIINIQKSCLM
jgi:hypothetical protein